MSAFIEPARTMHRLSIAGMEEASRSGLRVADLEHLLLALTVESGDAGRVLRARGMTLERVRIAIAEQHSAQLGALGVSADAPPAGRIVFHETDGYSWSDRALRVFTQAAASGKAGDARAVLRELLAEPSGLIAAVVERLGSDPGDVAADLADADAAADAAVSPKSEPRDRLSGATEAFIPAPPKEVWALVSDPARFPEWDPGIGSVGDTGARPAVPGEAWIARSASTAPDGSDVKTRADLRRVRIEMREREPERRVVWRLAFPDAPRANSRRIEFALAPADGGTALRIAFAWQRASERPRLRPLAWLMRPLYRIFIGIQLSHLASGVSRGFR